jgi:hypothetical protein
MPRRRMEAILQQRHGRAPGTIKWMYTHSIYSGRDGKRPLGEPFWAPLKRESRRVDKIDRNGESAVGESWWIDEHRWEGSWLKMVSSATVTATWAGVHSSPDLVITERSSRSTYLYSGTREHWHYSGTTVESSPSIKRWSWDNACSS